MRILLLFAFLMCIEIHPVAYAAQHKVTSEQLRATEDNRTSKTSETKTDSVKVTNPPIEKCLESENPEIVKLCTRAHEQFLKYYIFSQKHRETVFWWQHVTTIAIFFVVLALVAVGIYFAWRQFNATLLSGNSDEAASSTIEIGTTGVKVSSPILVDRV